MKRYRVLALAGSTLFMASVILAANRGIDHPGITLVRALPYGDKIGHIVLWGLFTAVLNLALAGRSLEIAGRRLPVGTVFVAAVVIVEEASQGWLVNRTLDPLDLLANFIGIGLATAAGFLVFSPGVSPGAASADSDR